MRWILAFGLAALLVASCGGGGDGYLAKNTVTTLPVGDASGSDYSGQYDVELYTSDCQGNCPVIDAGWFTWTICDVGNKDDDVVTVTQTDGRLQVDSDAGLDVTRLIGGINADGTFDVGGYATEEGGDVQIVARAEGSLSGTNITATAQAHAWGRTLDTGINCTATYAITGTRLGENP